ncbi:MAG: hypothetical protein LBM02_06475 [Lachnospiraceae bacterium]|jgi:prefoldin subunit 5|nr:hypothetical protein [Lachnospiraceae bacterium]
MSDAATLQKINSEIAGYNSQINLKNEQLEKLTTAKKSLKSTIELYKTFELTVISETSNTEYNDFYGTNRKTYGNKITEVRKKMDKYLGVQESNLTNINIKITQLQLDIECIQTNLATANNSLALQNTQN